MKFKVFIKSYQYEFITLIVNIITIFLAFVKLSQKQAFLVSLVIFLFSTFFIIYLRTKDKTFYFLSLDHSGQDKDFVGRGNLRFSRNGKCFEITNSDAGFILPKTLNWDDYIYKFDFKIISTSIGFIVRADNLSNGVMYQIFIDRIRPHLRINGEWIAADDVTLEKVLSLDSWYKLLVTCEKRDVKILILDKNENTVCDRSFIIPPSIKVTRSETNSSGHNTITYTQNVDFDFGAVGLRNSNSERAFVKNIFIERM